MESSLSKMDFLKLEENKKMRNSIRSFAIILYVLAVFNAVVGYSTNGPLVFIDVAIMLVCGIFIHLKASLIASIGITVYGIVNMVLAYVSIGQIRGWLFPVIGIGAIVYTAKLIKEYKNYKANFADDTDL